MNKNQHILDSLRDYQKIANPGYAILIKGEWGCGKTFFINDWLKAQKDKVKETDEIISLKPVFVSLYGITSTIQIDEAIKKVLSPILNSKIVKGAGKVLQAVTSAAMHYNIDIDGDGVKDRVVCTIDPRMLLEGNTKNVKGKRILVFDDIERCKLHIGETLGYINYYVERLGCHVVIIGDTDKINGEDYLDIKEKTIGREYLLYPETEKALDSFIKEADPKSSIFKVEDKKLILFVLGVSGKVNLRILRQSINDFVLFISHLPKDIVNAKEFGEVRQALLANFVAIYSEYKSGLKSLESFQQTLSIETVSSMINEKESKPRYLFEVVCKYENAGLEKSHQVLTAGYVDCVMNYLKNGIVNSQFLQIEVNKNRKDPWIRLDYYMTLSNMETDDCINKTFGVLESEGFKNPSDLLKATCNLLLAIKKGLTKKYKTETIIEKCLEAIKNTFFSTCKSLDELYQQRAYIYQCIGYYSGESTKEETKILRTGIVSLFDEIAKEKKDVLTQLFESMKDDNIDQIQATYAGTLPDKSRNYAMSSIFARVDAKKFVDSYVKLSNVSKVQILQLIRSHYHIALGCTNLHEMVNFYVDDLRVLSEIIDLLENEKENYFLVDRLNIEELVQCFKDSKETIETAEKKRKALLKGEEV